MRKIFSIILWVIAIPQVISCINTPSANDYMIDLLADVSQSDLDYRNPFSAEAKIGHFDSLRQTGLSRDEALHVGYQLGLSLLELGDEHKAVSVLEEMITAAPPKSVIAHQLRKQLAMANLRIGERTNCVTTHSTESCIFPIAGKGVHLDKTGSEKAIALYDEILKADSNDLESRWLINIAYMTTGGYPDLVPARHLIKGLNDDTSRLVKPFLDAAPGVGLNTENLAGGSIVEDFSNDGYLDLITSSWSLKQGMHYCRNNGNGTFTDISDSSGLSALKGGLHIMQTDYNNDGWKDIFVLRGAWKRMYGREPNSLLRNNGDGTFTDVTKQSGLLSFHPTQTATWADFDNDGWLDVFIGNETTPGETHTSELYMNNRNGTFTEVAAKAGCGIRAFVKGVTSGDFNKDGLTDLFISTLDGRKFLFKNMGGKNNGINFKDVTVESGLYVNTTRTFPTWFWDYDNDGWLDLLICGYEYNRTLAWYVAGEALGMSVGNSGKIFLFRNNQDGTFSDVSAGVGLTKVAFAMGSNFGDIDNDGYLDIYLGTGNPEYQSLVPNKMFKNIGGQKFVDVTTAARVGNLQKGHGVSFADLDYDGDQDIYIEMGGAYDGDGYQNSLLINPGQNDNRWINLSLVGKTSNRAAIGAKIKVTFIDDTVTRSVYRDVNGGGSFGSNPLVQHIGIGQAKAVERLEITWPVTGEVQVFQNLTPCETLVLTEGSQQISRQDHRKVDFTKQKSGIIACGSK